MLAEPCPFCDGTPKVVDDHGFVCYCCKKSIDELRLRDGDTAEQAVEIWNDRVRSHRKIDIPAILTSLLEVIDLILYDMPGKWPEQYARKQTATEVIAGARKQLPKPMVEIELSVEAV